MITLITAIMPEAKAVLAHCSMKRIYHGTISVYESEDNLLRLLVTGAGKLRAAVAVSEYLSLYPAHETDLFCNIGICGSTTGTIGSGYLCASVTEHSTRKVFYPELYSHPFSEACLYTTDVPVNDTNSSDTQDALPSLFDMEAYGIAFSLSRKGLLSRCFFYKIVSDLCDGKFPTPVAVTELVTLHLDRLLPFLNKEATLITTNVIETGMSEDEINQLISVANHVFPLSLSMERRIKKLLTYAACTGWSYDELVVLIPKDVETPHKKRAAVSFLSELERQLLCHKDNVTFSSTHKKTPLRFPSRVYVEREIFSHPVTQKILNRFLSIPVMTIEHYKDIFNRTGQNLSKQEYEPCLILAANHGTLFYPGAPVCQSFGEEHFIYTSCIMNCIYDCDYCYLQGMYPSRNIVVFVNLEDYFKELDALLQKHPTYLCCSYDSDLMALNGVFPHGEEFCRYAYSHPELRLELRTKSAALPFIKTLPAAKNIVLAFTLSPQDIISQYEHHTPSLQARLLTAKEAARRGFSLRLCIDPILDTPDAETNYSTLVDSVFSVLTPEDITDISLGVFRLSKDYLKQLRKAKPNSAISHYPYELTDGVCHYSTPRSQHLLRHVTDALHHHGIKDTQIFIWTPEQSEEGDVHADK